MCGCRTSRCRNDSEKMLERKTLSAMLDLGIVLRAKWVPLATYLLGEGEKNRAKRRQTRNRNEGNEESKFRQTSGST